MKQTSQRKQKSENQKSHPYHIKSRQYISRKIRPLQKRQYRTDLVFKACTSKDRRKKELHSKNDPANCKKSQNHRFSGTSLFFAYSNPKGRSPAPEKAHKSVYRSRSHRSPVNPVSGSFITSIKYSVFPALHIKASEEESLPENPSGHLSDPPSSLHSAMRSQTTDCNCKKRQPFSGNPADQTFRDHLPQKVRKKCRTCDHIYQKNSPINRIAKSPVLLESSPYAGVRRINQIT